MSGLNFWLNFVPKLFFQKISQIWYHIKEKTFLVRMIQILSNLDHWIKSYGQKTVKIPKLQNGTGNKLQNSTKYNIFYCYCPKKKLKMKSFEKITFLKKPLFSNKMVFSTN
jgi:hypothetical protein